MTDDQTLLDLAGRATPRPWPVSRDGVSIDVHLEKYKTTRPYFHIRDNAAYASAACNEVPRLISEKRSEAARADLTGFMLAWVVAVAGRGVNWSDLEDDFADAIDDSMDMDWTARDGAKAVVRVLDQIVGGAE